MKRIIIISLFALAALPLRAQSTVEWVQGFSGSVKIVRMETDSRDNLYIIGDGDPTGGYGQQTFTGNQGVFIMKVSPDGEALWKKEIYQQNGSVTRALDMHLIGDTALALISELYLPMSGTSERLYYLDSLYLPSQNYPFKGLRHSGNVLTILDLDGNLIEHHYLQVGGVDSAGNLISQSIRGAFSLYPATFWVDDQGYFYISRGNSLSFNGTQWQLIIDGDSVSTQPPSDDPYSGHIFKMSPHLDTLLWCRPLVHQRIVTQAEPSAFMLNPVRCLVGDGKGGLYASGFFDHQGMGGENTIMILDSVHPELRVIQTDRSDATGFVAKYDTDGNMLWVKQITALSNGSSQNNPFVYEVRHYNAKYDPENDQLIVATDFLPQRINGDTVCGWDYILNEGDDPDGSIRDGSGYVRLNAQTGHVDSYGVTHTQYGTQMSCNKNYYIPSIDVRNNQVATLVQYQHDLICGDSTLTCGSNYGHSLAYIRWGTHDYELEAKDFHSSGNVEQVYHAAFGATDCLYLSGRAGGTPNLDGHTFTGRDFIAKLTNPVFLPGATDPADTLRTTPGGDPDPDPNAIAPVAPEEILSVEYYDVLGRRLPAAPGRGLYLVRTVTTQGVSTRKVARMTNL